MKVHKSVLVIRHDDEFSKVLREGGLSVIDLPLIKTEPLEDLSGLLAVLERIDYYDGLFFTSPVSAEIFVNKFDGRDRIITGKVFAMGARANRVLANAGIETVFDDSVRSAEELIETGGDKFDNKKLLFVRGDRSVHTIPDMLKDRAIVDELVVYRTVLSLPDKRIVEDVAAKIENGEIDWVCFFSPSAVEAFKDVFGSQTDLRSAAIGRTTAGMARELGFDVGFISPKSNSVSFGQSFLTFLNE